MTKPVDPFVAQVALDYGEDLVRFLSKRVRTAADARDLAQEAYVRLLRLDRKDLVRDPHAYLYRIAANLLSELELKRRAETVGLKHWTEEQALHSNATGPDRAADMLGMRGRLQEVLRELSPKCRAVLILHRRDGMTYDEIAKRIGISSSMVKKYLGIGLRHCRSRLGGLTE